MFSDFGYQNYFNYKSENTHYKFNYCGTAKVNGICTNNNCIPLIYNTETYSDIHTARGQSCQFYQQQLQFIFWTYLHRSIQQWGDVVSARLRRLKVVSGWGKVLLTPHHADTQPLAASHFSGARYTGRRGWRSLMKSCVIFVTPWIRRRSGESSNSRIRWD